MKQYLSIVSADSIIIRRDPTLLLLFWVPLMILAAVRFGIPELVKLVPAIAGFYLEIISFFALLNSVFPGFILAFILLDEKDQQLLPVLKVTPFSLSGVLITRIGFLVLLGFFSSLILLEFNGIYSFSYFQSICIALLSALNVPSLILVISTWAKNKIEGLTLLKAANITIMIPVAVLFIENPIEYLFGIFPASWVYFLAGSIDSKLFFLHFIVGFISIIIINIFAFRWSLRQL